MIRYFFFSIVLLLSCSSVSVAQLVGGSVGADSVNNAIVPVVSYSSIEGLVGGAIYNRYDYSGTTRPFKNYLESAALVSTKGFIEVDGRFEQTRTFDRNIRSIWKAHFYRYTTDVYFGIGNDVPFSKAQWENDYYYFRSISLGLSYTLRKPIYSDNDSQLDVKAGFSTSYQIPYIKKQQSSFARQTPPGSEGGWVNTISTGLIWENRDSEFDPHHGNRADLGIRYAPDPVSSYAITSFSAGFRQYFQLFNWLTVANRLQLRHVQGNVPYWEFSTLGNKSTLRGYPLNRFKGNSSVAYTLEVRGWLYEFPDFYRMKLGVHVFTDAGRVFTAKDDAADLFEGYKQTIGFGGAMSIFNPDFILRGEIGFSEEVSRIYIGIGYLF